MNPHNSIKALDHPIAWPNRRWQCRMCGEIGRLDDLAGSAQINPCGYVYPPCEWCGQTPTCAADCKGIAQALATPGVRCDPMKRKVLQAVQSPMNAQRWSVDLECGHECWVTSTRLPRVVDCLRVECNTADAQAMKPRQKRLANKQASKKCLTATFPLW